MHNFHVVMKTFSQNRLHTKLAQNLRHAQKLYSINMAELSLGWQLCLSFTFTFLSLIPLNSMSMVVATLRCKFIAMPHIAARQRDFAVMHLSLHFVGAECTCRIGEAGKLVTFRQWLHDKCLAWCCLFALHIKCISAVGSCSKCVVNVVLFVATCSHTCGSVFAIMLMHFIVLAAVTQVFLWSLREDIKLADATKKNTFELCMRVHTRTISLIAYFANPLTSYHIRIETLFIFNRLLPAHSQLTFFLTAFPLIYSLLLPTSVVFLRMVDIYPSASLFAPYIICFSIFLPAHSSITSSLSHSTHSTPTLVNFSTVSNCLWAFNFPWFAKSTLIVCGDGFVQLTGSPLYKMPYGWTNASHYRCTLQQQQQYKEIMRCQLFDDGSFC